MKTFMTVHPLREMRTLEEMFDRVWNTAPASAAPNSLAIDVLEHNNHLVISASVPGIAPEDLDVQIENNVLTIQGESKQESFEGDVKVYRRETTYGKFARSLRLPENLNLAEVDAQFKNGVVTIRIPRVEEVKPAALKVPIRTEIDAASNEIAS